MVKVYRKVSPIKSSHETGTMQVCRLFYKLQGRSKEKGVETQIQVTSSKE